MEKNSRPPTTLRATQLNSHTKNTSFHESANIKERNEVKEDMLRYNVPKWFRGLSSYQREASDRLHTSLRDDIQQRTTHRLANCLVTIGLQPLLCSADITTTINMSRGSDLAFLWFIYELFYKTPGDTYTVNEQLILSSISYLDLTTTLRELDRILPPPQQSKKSSDTQKRVEEKRSKKRKIQKQANCKYVPSKFQSYFDPQTRPKTFGQKLHLSCPNFAVHDSTYGPFRKINHVVPNETTRWFTDYQFDPSKRIAHNIIKDEINNVVKKFDDLKLDEKMIRTLCTHHKVIEELERSFERELQVIAKERCENYFDVTKDKIDACRKRIIEGLNRDANSYLSKFKKMTANSRMHNVMKVLSEDRIIEYDLQGLKPKKNVSKRSPTNTNAITSDGDKQNCGDNDESRTSKTATDTSTSSVVGNHSFVVRDSNVDCFSNNPDNQKSKRPVKNKSKHCNSLPQKELNLPRSKPVSHTSVNNSKRLSDTHVKSHEPCSQDAANDSTSSMSSKMSSTTFFEAPKAGQPYQFNYRRIFNTKENTPEVLNIKQTIIKAIDSDVKLLNQLHESQMNIDEVINNYTAKIWKESVAEKSAKKDPTIVEQNVGNDNDKIFKYNPDYYDPNDDKLMTDMLDAALTHMKQNPKFVLASLPEAYKIPALRHFINQRYGRRYSKEKRLNLFKKSVKAFHEISTNVLNFGAPPLNMGIESMVPYTRHDYVFNKSNTLKKRYYDKIDRNVMKHTRQFWFAMSPFLCTHGPPRTEFFAYMPSSIAHIPHCNIWKPTANMTM